MQTRVENLPMGNRLWLFPGVSGVGCTADDRHILYTVKFDCIGDIKFPRSKHSITGQMRVSQQAFKALCYYVE